MWRPAEGREGGKEVGEEEKKGGEEEGRREGQRTGGELTWPRPSERPRWTGLASPVLHPCPVLPPCPRPSPRRRCCHSSVGPVPTCRPSGSQ